MGDIYLKKKTKKKLNVTIAFVSVVHILTVEYMLTQKNHCTPSQLDLCTKTLPFILLLGQFKQTVF